jgi:hypothetical protein
MDVELQAVEGAGGRVKIFTEDGVRWVAQPEGFAELTAVLVRAGASALSVYVGASQSIDGAFGTQLVEDNPGGTSLTNFRLSLQSSSAGIRLLFPF